MNVDVYLEASRLVVATSRAFVAGATTREDRSTAEINRHCGEVEVGPESDPFLEQCREVARKARQFVDGEISGGEFWGLSRRR